MAEIKNNFLSSKMNQDIDDRLMPNNEYRYALNLEVNRSEASDVGTLQNILGNVLVLDGDFRAKTGVNDLECIGVLADESNNNIYIFLTNNTGTNYSPTAKNYIYVYNTKQNASTLLVGGDLNNPNRGAFLNFSTQSPIYGVNIIENLLFWTDNRNQPRRINVNKAFSNSAYYANEEQISVAKLSPLYAPELYRASQVAPGQWETTMYDVVSPKLPNGTTTNPYYNQNWAGDPAYLESKYVRFSYRYKFNDGEYSIMAPFTQITYIPKQDGYFLYSANPDINDEEAAYRSTIVGFMQNKVNNILLQIKLPAPADTLNSVYEISEIEILYKEADDIAVSAVDSIPTLPDPSKQNYFWNTNGTTYTYDYQSKKPFKTLPSRDVVRVYDTTPVKALSQEIVGNRVVYGNYQDKFSYPKYLNYNVGASQKLPFGFTADKGVSRIEYPNHSVKENRNYQVGVVLADRFGRQSGVILSDQIKTDFPGQFGASSLYLPYSGVGNIIPSQWPGNSLKILFNDPISPAAPNVDSGWPGIYNGDATSASYNPLGWYSYKIVVKQTEQDYYNVYLPGVMASYPNDAALELGKTSHTVLLNDNINKVPRDLSEVGPGQKQFRSSVILFPRVNNNTLAYNNEQYDPKNTYAFVNTIATNNSLFFVDGVMPNPPAIEQGFQNFYQITSDPLIARISTPAKLGVVTANTGDDVINLSVYETKPTESKLDIYWETSTAGLITELNAAINAGSSNSLGILKGWNFTLSEANGPGTITSSSISFDNVLGSPVNPDSVTISNVTTGTGVDVTSKFIIEQIGTSGIYQVKTAPGAYFYYGFNAASAEAYTFTINAKIGFPVISKDYTTTGALINVNPTITNKPTSTINLAEGVIDVYDFNGVNGSNPAGGNSTSNLSWSVTGNPLFSITSNGVLQNTNGLAEGTFNLVVTMTEASGATDTSNVTVTYPFRRSIVFTPNTTSSSTTGTVTLAGTVLATGGTYLLKAEAFAASSGTSVSTTLVVSQGGSNLPDMPLTANVTSFGDILSNYDATIQPGITYNWNLTVVKSGNGTGSGSINVSAI
jgi:hypothetical protein